jgi:hypothetical protein
MGRHDLLFSRRHIRRQPSRHFFFIRTHGTAFHFGDYLNIKGTAKPFSVISALIGVLEE